MTPTILSLGAGVQSSTVALTPAPVRVQRLVSQPEQLSFWPLGKPDKSIYLQSDGRFVCVNDADDTSIPYYIASAESQTRWPRLANK